MRTLALALLLLPALAFADLRVVIVEGLGGEERYATQFAEQVNIIEAASRALTGDDNVAVFRSGDFSRDALLEHFADLDASMQNDDRLLLYLVGHGSYDDHQYKFNIAGPDLTDSDLFDWLEDLPGTSQLVVNTSSSSGATLERLKRDDRTIIAATRGGAERHATRFGHYFAMALSDGSADLDKNEVISAEEAFEFAERQVADYYERNGQLATEHPRLEGDQAARFSLARLGTVRPARADAELDRLVSRRDALNDAIDGLRIQSDQMSVDAYQAELLQLMLQLAIVEEDIEAREQELGDEN
ncbi:MAG: hypothetical protein OEM63_08315 [Gammaproteobacteria bacterium]|nr:hypothetical protein [Gammaproteobacteria bacterium]